MCVLQVVAQRAEKLPVLTETHQTVSNKKAGWRIIPEDYDTNLPLTGHSSPSPPCLLTTTMFSLLVSL